MIYEDIYWNAAIIYLLAVIGFLLVVWKVGTKLPWRGLCWWLMWLYLCVVLTPWQGTDPEPYLAPAIIVAAFDFLDVGLQPALIILKPMIYALIAGTLLIVLACIVLRVRELKTRSLQDRIDPTHSEEESEDQSSPAT